MGFSRKRGRPKTEKQEKDLGTVELREKRNRDMTAEPIDLCLKRGLIDQLEHESAIRLKWLYTLRFGAPGISAYNPEKVGKSCFRADCEEWLKARSYEYDQALTALAKIGAKRLVMNICIFGQRPEFLMPYRKSLNTANAHTRYAQLTILKEGLELLTELFGKKSHSGKNSVTV